jgi:ATP-binding protein involved in chromosome partitioning
MVTAKRGLKPHKGTTIMAVTKEQVLGALAKVAAPGGKSLTEAGVLSDVVVSDGKVFFSITVDAATVKAWEPVRSAAEAAVKAVAGVKSALVALTAERAAGASRGPQPAHTAAGSPARGAGGGGHAGHSHAGHSHGPAGQGAPAGKEVPGIPGVDAIIAVASGKGGVGKSTTAVNLALGLRDLGLKVGMLDADIYGPSLPKLFAIKEKPEMLGGTRLKPIERYGLKIMSIGFLIDEETPMIWRGPMVISALTQMLREVEWGKLDILVVDMPPGTGDAQLTMAQQVPLKGAVIVSTPQDLALIDARRGIAMFNRVNVPVLGVVENMSYFMCPHCGTRSDIFAHGGARHEAERLGVPFLGEVPLHMTIREKSDSGLPVVATEPDGPHAKIYRDIATNVLAQIRGGASSGRTAPKIVIEA